MKNLLYENDRNSIINRINIISEEDKALWGKMTVNQMVCHSTDQIKMAMGGIKTDYIGNLLKSTLLKQLVLLGMPVPKGKIETVKELKQGVGGTPPLNFSEDIASLKSTINMFISENNRKESIQHPAFGYMNKKQWGRLVFLHLDYHLQQFGR